MAPRRGGGGGGRGSSVSSCPGAFSDVLSQVSFAQDVLFTAVFLGLAIALCSVRKKSGQGKSLIGVFFILAILCQLISYALQMVSTILVECGTSNPSDIYNWFIATTLFFFLGFYLLLVVVVWKLNTMLRAQLGHLTAVFKVIYLAIIGVMGALTCTLIGLASYNNWVAYNVLNDRYNYSYGRSDLFMSEVRLRVAYNVLYLLSVLAAGALALLTIKSLRSRRNPAGDLIGWVVALFFFMVLMVIILTVLNARSLSLQSFEWETVLALSWIQSFSNAMSFIILMCIAKHRAWNTPAGHVTGQDTYSGVAQPPQYAYNAPNGQQNHYYEQQPVYKGAAKP